MKAHALYYIGICGLSGCTIFFYIVLWTAWFLEKRYWRQNVWFDFSLQLSSEVFLVLRRTRRDIIINVHMSICKVLVIIGLFKWKSNFLNRFSKNIHIIFNENPSSGAELFHANGRTDMTKLIVAFRNFAFAPKKETNPDVQLLLCYICLYTTRTADRIF